MIDDLSLFFFFIHATQTTGRHKSVVLDVIVIDYTPVWDLLQGK